MRGYVKGFEVVVIVLNLWPTHHLVRGPGEDRLNAVHRLSHRMQAARLATSTGQRDIDPIGGKRVCHRCSFQRRLTRRDRFLQRGFRLVNFRAGLRSFLRFKFAQPLEQFSQAAFLT